MQVNGNLVRLAEINFLCVHKKLRSKRLAPLLIRVCTHAWSVSVALTGPLIKPSFHLSRDVVPALLTPQTCLTAHC